MAERASKSGWTRVAFGDVVRLSRERSAHPEEDGFERYVGLDHLEPGDLKLRRWGDVSDGTTFTNVFHPGQVLFGKRRAYQRKVAVADFDGVCSGDIYVLEPSSPALLPELLPFICQTDGFFEHAVGTSAGSLSPRTNWTSLASYEFALPPLEEQRRIAKAMIAFEQLLNRYTDLTETAARLLRSSMDDALGLPSGGDRSSFRVDVASVWKLLPLFRLVSPHRPISYGILKPGDSDPSGVPMLRVMDFDDLGRRTDTHVAMVSHVVADTSRSTYLKAGDVLVSVMATVGRSFLVPPAMEGWNVNRALAVLPFGNEQRGAFVEAFFQSGYVQRLFRVSQMGSAQPRINLDFLKELIVPVPPSDIEASVVGLRKALGTGLEDAERRMAEIGTMKTNFINSPLT